MADGGAMRDTLRGSRILVLDFTIERDAVKAGKALAHACGRKVLVRGQAEALGGGLETGGRGARFSFECPQPKNVAKLGGKPQVMPADDP